MIVGYARVSTKDQSIENQIAALKAAGCEKIFTDKLSGKSDQRPGLQEAVNFVREGDTLIVTKLDRFGRSIQNLLNLLQKLDDAGAKFKALDQSLDLTTSHGKLTMHILAAVAEFERSLINDRVRDGIDKAMAKGVQFGRKRSLSDDDVVAAREMRDAGTAIPAIAKRFEVSRQTVYRALAS